MKQCLTIAKAVGQMLEEGTVPQIGGDPPPEPLKSMGPDPGPDKPSGGGAAGKGRLKIVK